MRHADVVLRHHSWNPIVDVVDSMCVKRTSCGSFMILALYVDDLLVSGPAKAVEQAMTELRREGSAFHRNTFVREACCCMYRGDNKSQNFVSPHLDTPSMYFDGVMHICLNTV